MAVYVVTWNLNKEKSNYNSAREAFIKQLDRYESIRDTGLETVRFVSSTSTAEQISEFLRQKLDSNDRLFVSRVYATEKAGWLEEDVWKWINARA